MTTQTSAREGLMARCGHSFTGFMASGWGRVARMALGLGLISTGLAAIGGPIGYAVAAFGLVPIAAGVLNLCPVAPLWGGHFLGASYCARRPMTHDETGGIQ